LCKSTTSGHVRHRLDHLAALRGFAPADIGHVWAEVIDGPAGLEKASSQHEPISAGRKAAPSREVIEPVTDVAEVVDLHNRFFFSPVWAGDAARDKIF